MFTIYQQKAYITVRTECLIYMSHTKFSHLNDYSFAWIALYVLLNVT